MLSGSTSNRKVRKKLIIRLLLVGIIALFLLDVQSVPQRQVSAQAGVYAIKLYQNTAGRMMRGANICKFTPTCSHYGIQALQKYGFLKGTWKTAGRILRCSPFSKRRGEDLP